MANFNETFPLFNWYVVETDITRYKNTGIHTVYDAGGPADGISLLRQAPSPATRLAARSALRTLPWRTRYENHSSARQPAVPGAVYCATCGLHRPVDRELDPSSERSRAVSTGRIDPPWVLAEGWQGYSGQNNFIEFGKTPYVARRERRHPRPCRLCLHPPV